LFGFARKISPTKTDAIQKMKVTGLNFIKESQRVYPKGETACHLVGFTGIDNDGLEGIELAYNSFLKGVPGWRPGTARRQATRVDFQGSEMVEPVNGYNIHLTLDELSSRLRKMRSLRHAEN